MKVTAFRIMHCKRTNNMKKLLAITLCIVLVAMSGNVFGQVRPGKKTMKESTSQLKTPAVNLLVDNSEACWEITGQNGYREYRWDTKANVMQWVNEMRNQNNVWKHPSHEGTLKSHF